VGLSADGLILWPHPERATIALNETADRLRAADFLLFRKNFETRSIVSRGDLVAIEADDIVFHILAHASCKP
jgi:hypothetical protein